MVVKMRGCCNKTVTKAGYEGRLFGTATMVVDNLPNVQILSIVALLQKNAIRNGTFSLQNAKTKCLNNRHP